MIFQGTSLQDGGGLDPVRDFEIILGLLFVAALVQPLARRLDVPLAIAQVVCGLLLSAMPFVPRVEFDPELTFTLFVPPLLFWASTTGSLRDVRRNARPILLLAVALVLVTTAAVAVIAHAVAPQLPWASAFVLGAIVAPPDADVTTSIARRLGVPPRLVTILEGETLLNDTAAFVTYRMAVRAAVIGTFSLAQAAVGFVAIAAGGVVVGLAVGWLVAQLTRLLADSVVETTISLLTPFAAYLIAERVGASGVLAVVTAGFCFSRFVPRTVSPRTRVRARSMWETVTFLIGGLVFTLIGVQLGRLAPLLWRGGDWSVLRVAGLVSATVIGARLIWVFLAAYVPRFASPRLRARDPYPSWRTLAVVAWAGLRGGDTLVMVLAVPYRTAAGTPFPGRETVIAVAFGVILATLIVQGLTLRPLIRRLALPHDDTVEAEERHARLEAARASRKRLEELTERENLPRGAVTYLRAAISLRTRLDLDEIDHSGGHDGQTSEDVLRQAEQEVRDAAREAVVRLRDRNVIGQEALRRVQNDLDLDEVRSIDELPIRTTSSDSDKES
jgi:monovalent cation/hydrogen antiporter